MRSSPWLAKWLVVILSLACLAPYWLLGGNPAGAETAEALPHHSWSERFLASSKPFLGDGVELTAEGVKLAAGRDRHWFAVTDTAQVTRAGGWPAGPRCAKAGASLTLKFSGTKLVAYAPQHADLGIVEVSIDGGKARPIDLYGDSWHTTRRLVLADRLADQEHTATVCATGKKQEKSKGIAAHIDVFEASASHLVKEGTVLSTPLVCPPDREYRWRRMHYDAAATAGQLRVDVLDGAGNVLLANAAGDADLSGLRSPILQLRATLTSPDRRQSPLLRSWQVDYAVAAASVDRQGIVLDAITAKPIAGAQIMFFREGKQVKSLTCDASGHFSAANLSAGSYRVTVVADGYLENTVTTDLAGPAAAPGLALYPREWLLGERLKVWSAGAMNHVFQDSLPPPSASGTIALEAAANEYEPAQLAIRASMPLGVTGLSVASLARRGSGYAIPPDAVRTYFVGYVPVMANSGGVPEGGLSRRAPAWFPDPLLPEKEKEILPHRTQPVWLTVKVPNDAPPGEYSGSLSLHTAYGTVSVPLAMTVWPFRLTDETHRWIGHGCIGWAQVLKHYAPGATEDSKWRVFQMALADRVAHRENVIYIDNSVFNLCRVTAQSDGTWKYDFAELDRWLDMIRAAYPHGRFLIEAGCFAARKGWTTSEIFFNGCPVRNEKGDADPKRSLGNVSTDSEDFRRFARPFFAALEKHLDQQNMLEKFYTRLQDEPLESCRPAYKRLAVLVHESAPRLRRFESIQCTGFAEDLEIQNPQLNYFDKHRDEYFRTRRPGCQIWFYTCWQPQGRYPSRLIDYPPIKTRIISWMQQRMGADGYDRYGWAEWWSGSPYDFVGTLAPGDDFVVYPDPNRKEIIGSVRWEMMRESVEDGEYLWTLGQRLDELASRLGARAGEFHSERRLLELSSQAVNTCTDYELDPTRLLDLRRRVAREIVATQEQPRVVLETEPPCLGTIKPQSVTIRGITDPGTSLTANGASVPIRTDGRFETMVPVSAAQRNVEVRLSSRGATRVVERSFVVADVPKPDKKAK